MSSTELENNRTDLIVSTLKSVFGTIPILGSGLSELIGILIPNQRIDRLTKYIKELENKLNNFSSEKLKEFLKNEECIDLFEESFIQASRALSDEKRSQIASVVKNGLDETSIEYSTSKYMLKLLQELNDQEIIWLRYYLMQSPNDDKEFREKHKNILYQHEPLVGGENSLWEKKALTESFQEHLERLGLIRTKKITILGQMLLRQIGLLDDKSLE